MCARVISNREFRCWASCPSQGDSNSRQPHPGLTRLVYIDIHHTNDLPSNGSCDKTRARAVKRQGYYEGMGFFSSRKDETSVSYVATTTPASDKSVVQVIRSRFYGKKGKEREERLPVSSSGSKNAFAAPAGRATTSVLIPPPTISASAYDSIGASPRPSTSQRPPIPTSILQSPYVDRSLPATPQKKRPSVDVVPGSASSIRSSKTGPTTPAKRGDSSVMLSPAHRKHADSVTVTLAQRLNELAVANSEGLLNDDEYRLLRQSLFDRFAGTAVVPQEEAIVPAVRPRPKRLSVDGTPERPTSRPLSNFQVELPRPDSPHSRNSMSFGVSDLFRKATNRRSSTTVAKDSDTSSIWSSRSSSSKLFRLPRLLSKNSSSSSINTTASRMPGDTISISSKRGGASDRGHSDQGHHGSSSGPRSATGSARRHQTPPSSFPNRAIGQDARYATNVRDVFDEENLKTSQDIQKEIMAVEGEQRRLIDAFMGLELTTLSKVRRRHNARPGKGMESNAESGLAGSPTRSHRRLNPSESDALSIRSGVSARTTPSLSPSVARSAYSSRNKTLRAKSGLNSSLVLPSSSSSLHRKDSSSSFASDGRWYERGPNAPPPVPAIPLALHGHLRAANNSSISLARSTGHLPMDVVHEDEDRVTVDTVRMEEDDDYENEMDDIRRRREEVNTRYEGRLEYLRAKLKGAQLHEKLLKK